MKAIAVLGSTGSIGTSTLAVAEAFPEHFAVVALAAGSNLNLLREQIRRHRPALAGIADDTHARALAAEFPDTTIVSGPTALEDIARHSSAELVVVAVVGALGLLPTMAAVETGRDVALATKETLVMAGELVMAAVGRANTRLLPVDSEHSAIHRLVEGHSIEQVQRLVLTASGGPFRTWTEAAIASASPDDALAHPTWTMGPKISVDSATLMNKGFEIIEAHHLFGIPGELIDIVIHPQSLIHALVEFADGSLAAQISPADMRLPIAHALSWPEPVVDILPHLDVTTLPPLTFEKPDTERFPALDLARTALRDGGEMPAVLNAANEIAVAAFLEGRISFPAVSAAVAETLDTWRARSRPLTSIDQALAVDGEARKLATAKLLKYNSYVHGSEKQC